MFVWHFNTYGGIFVQRVFGYNRVSTMEQHLDRGRKRIEDFCASRGYNLVRVFEDKVSGRSFARPRYTVMKEDVLASGDILVVPEFDRLGRADETRSELQYYVANNIRVVFLDIPTTQIDYAAMPDATARMVMSCINDMLISFYDLMSRTELERRAKRQREGIQAKKDRGEWASYGRPRVMAIEEFTRAYERVERGEIGSLALMRELGLNRDTFFRYVREAKASKK
ncbi:MAG: recombinase family protein [Clostridia bacterium]|nr:recombinase family protein [Clostridia bacterium]